MNTNNQFNSEEHEFAMINTSPLPNSNSDNHISVKPDSVLDWFNENDNFCNRLSDVANIEVDNLLVGEEVFVGEENILYERADDSASDYHVQSGSYKLYETGKNYSSEKTLADSIMSGRIPNNTVVKVGNLEYVIDNTVSYGDSILRDYGVSGVRQNNEYRNEYLGAFFRSRFNSFVHFNTSYNGEQFSSLTKSPILAQEDGTSNKILGGRDVCVLTYKGKWYTLYTASSENLYDFRMGESNDMLNWTEHRMSLGATVKTSPTDILVQGASVPSHNIWGPEHVFNPTDKQLYIVLSVVYDTGLTDDYGNGIRNRRPMYSTFDPENKIVGEPVSLNMGGDEASISYIGHTFHTDENDNLYMAIKNDVSKKLEIWMSDSGIEGLFTKIYTSTSDKSQEGYSWVNHFVKQPDGTIIKKHRIYIDENRHGPNHPYQNKFAEVPWYIEADSPSGPWSDPKRVFMDASQRHGYVLNLGHNISPKFREDVNNLRNLHGNNPRSNIPYGIELTADRPVTPQEEMVYYVQGGTNVDIVVLDGSADTFYIGLYDDTSSVNVSFEAGVSNTPISYTFGPTKPTLIQFRRSHDKLYYPVSRELGSSGSSATIPSASTSVEGKIRIAKIDEINDGLSGPSDAAITPSRLAQVRRYFPSSDPSILDTDKILMKISSGEMVWTRLKDIDSNLLA